MVANHHSLLWSKYSTVIPVPYLDTLDSWYDSMNIVSSFVVVFYIILPVTT